MAMINFDGNWFSANDDNNGLPVILRGRNKLTPLIGLKSHPNLIKITWRYELDGPHGLAAPEEDLRMDVFERAVFDALEAETVCIFYCVYQHNGQKEWLAYCTHVDAAEEILNVALMGHEEYPIELTVEADPEWSDYQAMMAGTGHA